jgi:hypothetical protein
MAVNHSLNRMQTYIASFRDCLKALSELKDWHSQQVQGL